MPTSLLESLFAALEKEATGWEQDTGRGKGGRDKYEERVGVSKGLRRAIEVVRETAKAVNTEDD